MPNAGTHLKTFYTTSHIFLEYFECRLGGYMGVFWPVKGNRKKIFFEFFYKKLLPGPFFDADFENDLDFSENSKPDEILKPKVAKCEKNAICGKFRRADVFHDNYQPDSTQKWPNLTCVTYFGHARSNGANQKFLASSVLELCGHKVSRCEILRNMNVPFFGTTLRILTSLLKTCFVGQFWPQNSFMTSSDTVDIARN